MPGRLLLSLLIFGASAFLACVRPGLVRDQVVAQGDLGTALTEFYCQNDRWPLDLSEITEATAGLGGLPPGTKVETARFVVTEADSLQVSFDVESGGNALLIVLRPECDS